EMFSALTTSPHSPIALVNQLANSSGVLVFTLPPSSLILSTISGVARILRSSEFSRATIAGGVPLLVRKPCQEPVSTIGMPSSLNVGKEGTPGRRLSPETAMPLSWFWATNGRVASAPLKITLLSLETTARIAAAPQRYGTMPHLSPYFLAITIAVRCWIEPTPLVPTLSLPGLAL